MNHPVFLERSAEESLDAAPYKLRRRNSETMRAQYINTKEARSSGTIELFGTIAAHFPFLAVAWR